MIAVDTNILIYAHREEFPQHRAALTALKALAEGDALWGIPIFCLTEFVRVATHSKLLDPPYDAAEVCTAIGRIVEAPSLRILHPGERFIPLFLEAVEEADATGNLAFDAQIVAVCRETGVSQFLTEDRDFSRFTKFPIERL